MKISDALKTRLHALGVTFTKTDRILTGNDKTTVKMNAEAVGANTVPSYTDGVNITINAGALPNLGDSKTLVSLLGLNYHEVSHNLFSPRNGSDLRTRINNRGLHRAFNILEDQRIETLFSAQYGSASKFFTAPVMQLIIDDEGCWPFAHIYVHGRRYLPKEIREEFRRKFKGDADLARRFERVIDEYRRMTFESMGDEAQGLRLVERFAELLSELHPSLNQPEQDSLGREQCDCKDMSKGSIDRQQQQRSSRRLADQEAAEDESEDDDNGDDDSELEDSTGSGDDEGSEDESDGDDGDSGSAAADGDDDSDDDESGGADDGGDLQDEPGEDDQELDGDSSGDGDDADDAGAEARGAGSASDELDADDSRDGGEVTDEEGESASGAANGAGNKSSKDVPQLTPEQLRDLVTAIQEAVEGDPEVQREIAEIRSALEDTSLMDVDLEQKSGTRKDATPELIATSERVGSAFARMFADLEAGWNFGTDHGRLNAMSAMLNPDDPDVWFDEWEEGHQEAAGLEVVLAVDLSVSMSGDRMNHANEAAWVLMRALHEIGANVSVVGFGQSVSRLYGRAEEVSASKITYFPANEGNTVPLGAIREARRILNESEQPNKLFAIITDGVWSNSDPDYGVSLYGGNTPGDIRSELEMIDGIRSYVGIGYKGSPCECEPQYAPAFHVRSSITDAHDVVTVVESIVTEILAGVGR